MISWRSIKLPSIFWLSLLILAAITACERPDPQDAAVEMPAETQTPLPTPTAFPTQPPIQVYVVVVQPTTDNSQSPTGALPVSAPVNTPTILVATPTPIATLEPTPWPEDYFMGWAWSSSLKEVRNQMRVVNQGLTLYDRPSLEGRTLGTVVGLAEAFIVGQARCGYTPILVHVTNILTRTTPDPPVLSPEPLPTEAPPFAPNPVPTDRFTAGWAYTEELTLLGETAISGALGINLRSEPCLAASNLGFVPAGSNMIVTGPQGSQYTPVRVNNDVLQLPLEFIDLIASRKDVLTSFSEFQQQKARPIGARPAEPSVTPSPMPSPTLTAATP